MPFTDPELMRIHEACDKLPEVQWKNRLGSGWWGGDYVKSMVTKGALFTWADDWLYERLLARERKYGPKIFACGVSERLETATDTWRRKINRAFDIAGKSG